MVNLTATIMIIVRQRLHSSELTRLILLDLQLSAPVSMTSTRMILVLQKATFSALAAPPTLMTSPSSKVATRLESLLVSLLPASQWFSLSTQSSMTNSRDTQDSHRTSWTPSKSSRISMGSLMPSYRDMIKSSFSASWKQRRPRRNLKLKERPCPRSTEERSKLGNFWPRLGSFRLRISQLRHSLKNSTFPLPH